jgi:hypothetical protein
VSLEAAQVGVEAVDDAVVTGDLGGPVAVGGVVRRARTSASWACNGGVNSAVGTKLSQVSQMFTYGTQVVIA